MILSKELYYESSLASAPCSEVCHPWASSCTEASLVMIKSGLLGTTKYILPFYLLQLISKYKTVDRNHVQDQAKSFLRTCVVGTFINVAFVGFHCMFRKFYLFFNEKPNPYTVSFWPSFIGGLGIFIEKKKKRQFIMNPFTNEGFAAILNILYYKKIIPKSNSLECLLFMISNAILMYHIQQSPSDMWIFKPLPVKENEEKCLHEGECSTEIYKSYISYFGFGLVIEILRIILFNFNQIASEPQILKKLLLTPKIFKLGNSLGFYVALYKLVCCILVNKNKRNYPEYSLLAGFISGVTYLLTPSHSLLTIVFNQAVQSLYRKSPLNNRLKHIPVAELCFALANAYCFHLKVFNTECCPPIFKKMMATCSSNRSEVIYKCFMDAYQKR